MGSNYSTDNSVTGENKCQGCSQVGLPNRALSSATLTLGTPAPQRNFYPVLTGTAPAAVPGDRVTTSAAEGPAVRERGKWPVQGGRQQEPSAGPCPSQSIPSTTLSDLCLVY